MASKREIRQEGLGTRLRVPILRVPVLIDAEKNVVFNSGRYSFCREQGSQWLLR
jgi:hypothetical protein